MARNFIKAAFKRVLPKAIVARYQRWRLMVAREVNAKSPIRDVFREVYARNRWGGPEGVFCSGTGSEESQAASYAAAVRGFVRDRNIKSIVDLGCGDYRVGRMLRVPGVCYLGIDIVPELVEHNRGLFSDSETAFMCRDLLVDELPGAELCLVRQVLQHLSNQEIAMALERLNGYKYVLVTEHYPAVSASAISFSVVTWPKWCDHTDSSDPSTSFRSTESIHTFMHHQQANGASCERSSGFRGTVTSFSSAAGLPPRRMPRPSSEPLSCSMMRARSWWSSTAAVVTRTLRSSQRSSESAIWLTLETRSTLWASSRRSTKHRQSAFKPAARRGLGSLHSRRLLAGRP